MMSFCILVGSGVDSGTLWSGYLFILLDMFRGKGLVIGQINGLFNGELFIKVIRVFETRRIVLY